LENPPSFPQAHSLYDKLFGLDFLIEAPMRLKQSVADRLHRGVAGSGKTEEDRSPNYQAACIFKPPA